MEIECSDRYSVKLGKIPEDRDYQESVENIICTQSVNAEFAVAQTEENFVRMFASMEDDYMRGRAADVRDISDRLLTILNGNEKEKMNVKEPVILVADDLTQYLLAVDRRNPALEEFCDVHHPAILRMIEQVVENAHKAGIRAGICGELGADPVLTRDFLAMGVDELSVSPGNILPLRKIIRETNVAEYRKEWEKSW